MKPVAPKTTKPKSSYYLSTNNRSNNDGKDNQDSDTDNDLPFQILPPPLKKWGGQLEFSQTIA
jgi:hypothetical protein